VTIAELRPGHIIASRFTVQSTLGHGKGTSTYEVVAVPNRALALRLYDPVVRTLPKAIADLQAYEILTNALPDNIVLHIVESGIDPQTGSLYSATELSPHPSLAQLVEICPLSPAEMAVVLTNLGRAMDLAHASGAHHLGLRPSNIFVGPAPSYDVRVADFGTALVRDLCPSDKIEQRTAWLAPEQMQSEGSGGQETDVFAAALVAFFALTSRSYWRSCRSKSLDTVRWRSEISLPTDSAAERAAELSVELPAGLDPVFARALARDPSQRFSTVGEFAVAFRAAVLPGEAANPLPAEAIEVDPSPPSPSESRVRPWKIASYAVAAGSVLAIAGIVWATARASKIAPRVERELADEAPQSAPRVVESPPIETASAASVAALPAASVPAPPGDQAPTAASAEAPAPESPVAAAASAIAPGRNGIIVTCTPPCDVIYVDGKKVPLVGQPIMVPPGKHMVTGTSGGLRPQNQLVRVKPGEPTNLDLTFPVPSSSPAATPAPRPAKKPCGKFLKRCD